MALPGRGLGGGLSIFSCGSRIFVKISNRYKNHQSVAFRVSINLPENAKNRVLVTLERKKFQEAHKPQPPWESCTFSVYLPPPLSFITLAMPLVVNIVID